MGQKSKIEQMPQEVVDQINRLLDKHTIEQVVEEMRKIGVELSMSGVGRHKKKIEDVARLMRDSRIIADAIGKSIDDQPDDKLAALNNELVHMQIMRIVTASEDGEPVKLEAKDVRALSESLRSLASASKTDAERVLKVRKDATDKALAAANEQLKKSGQQGMSAETVDAIKRNILGIST